MKFYDVLKILTNELSNLQFNDETVNNVYDYLFYRIRYNKDDDWQPLFLINYSTEEKLAVEKTIYRVLFQCGLIVEGIVYDSGNEEIDWQQELNPELNVMHGMQMKRLYYRDLSADIIETLFPLIAYDGPCKKPSHNFHFPVIIHLTEKEFVQLVGKYPKLLHSEGVDFFGHDKEKELTLQIIEQEIHEKDINCSLNDKMKEDFALSMALFDDPRDALSYILQHNSDTEINRGSEAKKTLKEQLKSLELERLWVDENGTVHLMDEKEDMDEKTIRVPHGLFA